MTGPFDRRTGLVLGGYALASACVYVVTTLSIPVFYAFGPPGFAHLLDSIVRAGALAALAGALAAYALIGRVGLVPLLAASFLIYGTSCAAAAFLPANAAIGSAASALYIACRIAMSLADGMAMGLVPAFVAAAAPARHRGLTLGLFDAARDALLFLVAIGGFTLQAQSAVEHITWNWNVLFFILGVGLVMSTLWFRRAIADPPPLEPVSGQTMWRVARIGIAGFFVLVILYELRLVVTSAQHNSRIVLILSLVGGAAANVAGAIGGGWLSDGFGRRPVVLYCAAALVFIAAPVFIFAQGIVPLAVSNAVIMALLAAMSAPLMLAVLEALPARRAAGLLAVIRAVPYAVLALLRPPAGGVITRGDALNVGLVVAVCLGVLLTLRETAPAKTSPT